MYSIVSPECIRKLSEIFTTFPGLFALSLDTVLPTVLCADRLDTTDQRTHPQLRDSKIVLAVIIFKHGIIFLSRTCVKVANAPIDTYPPGKRIQKEVEDLLREVVDAPALDTSKFQLGHLV